VRVHVFLVSRYNHACEAVVHELGFVHLAVEESSSSAEPPAAYVRSAHFIRVSAEGVTRHARPQGAEFSLRYCGNWGRLCCFNRCQCDDAHFFIVGLQRPVSRVHVDDLDLVQFLCGQLSFL